MSSHHVKPPSQAWGADAPLVYAPPAQAAVSRSIPRVMQFVTRKTGEREGPYSKNHVIAVAASPISLANTIEPLLSSTTSSSQSAEHWQKNSGIQTHRCQLIHKNLGHVQHALMLLSEVLQLDDGAGQ